MLGDTYLKLAPVGLRKVHNEESDTQTKKEKCVRDKGKAGKEGSK